MAFSWLRNRLRKRSKASILTFAYALLLLGSLVVLRIGVHILSRAKWLTEIIPLWLVILSAVIGVTSVTFLIQKKKLITKDIIAGSTGIVISLYGLSIGYQRFPSVFILTLFAVIFINWGLIKIRLQMKKRRNRDQPKKRRSRNGVRS